MAVSRGACDLPDDLIFYILLRIPVKSLIRFKMVSKSWNALITNPYFIRQHHSQQPSSKLLWMTRLTEDAKRTYCWNLFFTLYSCLSFSIFNFACIFRLYTNTYIYPTPLTFDTTSNSLCFLVKNAYKPIVPGSFDVWLLGHCFGVFCFWVNCHNNMDKPFMIALRNIATGETKEVPLNFGNNREVRYNFGFGCVVDNSSVPEFKIVSLEFVSGGGLSSHVYTSTTNTWKSVEPPCGSITLEHGIELNGVFHWMATGTRPVDDDDDQFILTFDLKKELFGRIEIPDETFDAILITKQDDKYLSLIYSSNGVINISVMRDSKSWVKQAKVVHDNRQRVVHDNNEMISWYKHGFGRLLTEVGREQGTKIVMATELFDYVESLVSFNF